MYLKDRDDDLRCVLQKTWESYGGKLFFPDVTALGML